MARAAGDRGVGVERPDTGRDRENVDGGRTGYNERKSPAQWFALIFGIVYLIVGIIGVPISGFDTFIGKDPDKVIVFSVNVLHNIVHVLIAVIWIMASRLHSTAKSANIGIGLAYAALGVLGLVNLDILGFIAANTADNWLHVGTGLLALLFGTMAAGGDREAVSGRTA